MENLLSSYQVCREAGVTYRQLDYWVRRGLVRPAVEAKGMGSQRRFDQTGLDRVRRIADLRREGFELEAAVRRAS